MAFVVWVEWWRAHVVAPSPEKNLLGSMALGGLFLVEALESPIVPLVQSPRSTNRKILKAHLVKCQLGGLDRPGQDGGMKHIWPQTFL